MNGDDGYCSKLLGHTIYRNAMSALKRVLENSECHTLDRHNMRAQRDSCGISDKDELDIAVDLLFSVNHWPLVHSNDEEDGRLSSTKCIKTLFTDSLENQQKLSGMFGISSVYSALMIVVMVYTLMSGL